MVLTPPAPGWGRRLFQSDLLDANVSLADLRYFSDLDLIRLGQEVRWRLRLLDAEAL